MDKDYLILKRASTSRPSGEWDDDDYDVLADGVVVGRIMETAAASVGQPWMWTLAFGYHARRRTAMPRRARLRWRRLQRAGGTNERKPRWVRPGLVQRRKHVQRDSGQADTIPKREMRNQKD